MLKRWMEILHTDEHNRQIVEMVPQDETPGDSRYLILFTLQLQRPLPNGRMEVAEQNIRHEIKAENVSEAFKKYAEEMVQYGKDRERAEKSRIVIPGAVERLNSRFNGGRKKRR